jgi:hypothetical protein
MIAASRALDAGDSPSRVLSPEHLVALGEFDQLLRRHGLAAGLVGKLDNVELVAGLAPVLCDIGFGKADGILFLVWELKEIEDRF